MLGVEVLDVQAVGEWVLACLGSKCLGARCLGARCLDAWVSGC